jgi:hypothetical protein
MVRAYACNRPSVSPRSNGDTRLTGEQSDLLLPISMPNETSLLEMI